MSAPVLLIDGAPATIEDLGRQALVNYGAYSSFRVEQGGVRGLDLHLARLDAAAETLFGEPVGVERLRHLMRVAVADRDACWLRVSLFSPEMTARAASWRGVPRVMTATSPPPPPLASSVRLHLQSHQRYLPQIKHAAHFDLIHARRLAREAGFDDALLADAEGRICEGSSWNIGFLSGDRVIWPQAPMLAGVTQALIARRLADVGMTSLTEPVHVRDLTRFDGAFFCNSATPACEVTAIGDHIFAGAGERIAALEAAWASNPLERL